MTPEEIGRQLRKRVDKALLGVKPDVWPAYLIGIEYELLRAAILELESE